MQCKVDWMGMWGSEQSREQHVDLGRQSQWLRSVTLEQELCHCRHLRPQCFNWHQAKFLCLRYNKGWVCHPRLSWACGSSVDRGREFWRQGWWIGEETDKNWPLIQFYRRHLQLHYFHNYHETLEYTFSSSSEQSETVLVTMDIIFTASFSRGKYLGLVVVLPVSWGSTFSMNK